MIPRLISIQYFNATLLVNNLVYIWVLFFFFWQKMEQGKFSVSHLMWVRELCNWEKIKGKNCQRRANLFLHFPILCILWLKIFGSLRCVKHYIKILPNIYKETSQNPHVMDVWKMNKDTVFYSPSSSNILFQVQNHKLLRFPFLCWTTASQTAHCVFFYLLSGLQVSPKWN